MTASRISSTRPALRLTLGFIWIFGILAIFGIKLNFFNVLMLPLIFGMGDYSASQQMNLRGWGGEGYPGDVFHYPRFRIAMAARAAGLDPVDGPYANFRNEEGFRREARMAFMLGFVGKWAIHPAQIAPALEIFSPTSEEVTRARELAAAYDKALAEGLGSVNVNGTMVDAASIRIVMNTVRKAELIGL